MSSWRRGRVAFARYVNRNASARSDLGWGTSVYTVETNTTFMSTPNNGIRIAFLAAIAVFAIVTVVTFTLIGGGAQDSDPTPDDALMRDKTSRI